MGALAAYSLYTGIYLLAGYLIYKTVMAGEKQAALNRAVLLGTIVLSLLAWPLGRISFGASVGTIDISDLVLTAGNVVAVSDVRIWPLVLTGLYLAGAVFVAVMTLVTALRLCLLVRGGRREHREGYTLIVLPAARVAPFSWGRYVVMSGDDFTLAGDVICAHELAHIRSRHSLDLLLAQAVCILLWYNPAAWLIREELKTVHEYQADEAVLRSGINPRTYQMLLIKKAVGTRFQSLANSLNHSNLKKRITMMYKEKNSGLRRLRGLVLALAPVAAMAVLNIPAVAGTLGSLRTASYAVVEEPVAASAGKDTEKSVKKPAVMPQFPGGEMEMMRYLMRSVKYPESAMKAGEEGRVLVGFTVKPDGSLADLRVLKNVSEALDAEALRVVGSMPAWTPGEDENGNKIAVEFALPVSFKLDGLRETGVGTVKKEAGGGNHVSISVGDSNLSKGKPTIMVDGEIFTGDINQLDSKKIESIVVKRDHTDYPDGLIEITMKK